MRLDHPQANSTLCTGFSTCLFRASMSLLRGLCNSWTLLRLVRLQLLFGSPYPQNTLLFWCPRMQAYPEMAPFESRISSRYTRLIEIQRLPRISLTTTTGRSIILLGGDANRNRKVRKNAARKGTRNRQPLAAVAALHFTSVRRPDANKCFQTPEPRRSLGQKFGNAQTRSSSIVGYVPRRVISQKVTETSDRHHETGCDSSPKGVDRVRFRRRSNIVWITTSLLHTVIGESTTIWCPLSSSADIRSCLHRCFIIVSPTNRRHNSLARPETDRPMGVVEDVTSSHCRPCRWRRRWELLPFDTTDAESHPIQAKCTDKFRSRYNYSTTGGDEWRSWNAMEGKLFSTTNEVARKTRDDLRRRFAVNVLITWVKSIPLWHAFLRRYEIQAWG